MTEETAIKALDNKIKVSALTVDDLALICEEEGVTVQSLMRTLSEGLKSNIIRVHNSGAEDTGEPDNPTRHKYLGSAMEVLKLIKKVDMPVVGKVEHQMAPGDIERLEAIAKELKGLETRLVGDSVQQGVIDV